MISVNGVLQNKNETHTEDSIHDGNHYYMEGFTTLNSGDTLYIKLVMPSDKVIHLTWMIESTAELETYLYEGASGMTGGSAVTPINSDRTSSNTSSVQITSGVTAPTDTGTTLSQRKGGAGTRRYVEGAELGRESELILKSGETYCRLFQSNDDNNIVGFRASWIETRE